MEPSWPGGWPYTSDPPASTSWVLRVLKNLNFFFYIPKNQIKYGSSSEVFLSQMSPLRGEEEHPVATALRIQAGALTHAMQAFTRGIAS